MCSSGPLRVVTVLIGLFFLVSSLCGVGLSLYLLFADDPLGGEWTQGTYSPSAEDVVPALLCSVVSLVLSVVLIGGAIQHSQGMLLAWLVWQVVLLVVFWAWYAYNQLKYHGYVEGLRGCYFCGLRNHESNVTSGGAVASFVIITCMIVVTFLHAIFKRKHRELNDPSYFLGRPESASAGYPHQYNQREQQFQMADFKEQPMQQQQQYNYAMQQQQQLQYAQQQQQLLQQQYLQQQLLQQQYAYQQQQQQQQQQLLQQGYRQ